MPRLLKGTRIHLVGIGGAGLSAIARILLERGCIVSGSDLNESTVTSALAEAGARIFKGHDGRFVAGADLVLATSAVDDDHIELAAANELKIPVYRRREFMRVLLQGCDTIAIAGTHGKTTTTSMIIHILQAAGKDPSYIVGGIMGNTGKNAAVGTGRSFVIEADEYDNMFHGLAPNLAVVTTVEHDHPDFFRTADDITSSFARFMGSVQPGGLLVACADDPAALALALEYQQSGQAVRTYGIENKQSDWRATDLRFGGDTTSFTLVHRGVSLGRASLGAPGAHNVLNALAALVVAHERGVDFEASVGALAGFRATRRRFEIRGIRAGVIVVDDYAHHPTAIKVNLRAAKLRYPGHQIWAIWQPHTYSRIRQFWSEFVESFHESDRVIVTPIYAAREAPIEGISSQALAAKVRCKSFATYAPTFDDAVAMLRQSVAAPAVVIIFSAGDANRIADLYLDDSDLS